MFYVSSNLLDLVCVSSIFVGVNLSWHILEYTVHASCHIFRESKYKELLCNM
jgi:hypothetical protein